MRARNGYAAVHDLLTRTRVIVRSRGETRPTLGEFLDFFAATLPVPPVETRPALAPRQIGPYEVRELLWQRAGEELLLGFDPVLHRRIWIHVRPLEAEAPNGERRRLSRPARLRCLNGAADEGFRWDAYEALEGRPLAALVRPIPWGPLRYWLLDLAEELSAQLDDPVTALPVGLDQMWITSTGRLFALEFAAPGIQAPAQSQSVLQPVSEVGAMQKVLDQIAAFALGEAREASLRCACLPLAAHDFLGRLRKGVFDNAGFIVGNLHSLLNKPAEISRSWRVASLSLVPAIILGLSLLAAGMATFDRIRWERAWTSSFPGLPSLRPVAAVYLSLIEEPERADKAKSTDALRVRAYLARHFGSLATNQVFWDNQDWVGRYGQEERRNLLQALSAEQNGELGPAELARIEQRIREREQEERIEPMVVWVIAGISVAALIALIELGGCLLGVVPSLRLFAIAVVDGRCRPASRGRLLLRWSLVWLPVGLIGGGGMIAALFGLAAGTPLFELEAGELPFVRWLMGVLVSACGLLLLGVLFEAIRRPAQSVADRLARTQLTSR